ncbi:MAG: phosphoribosylformylglycinamidine synthase subunit PurL [Candidatus Ranarchaeia archaeon]
MEYKGIQVDLSPAEFEYIKKTLGREPNFVEAGMCDVMFSEHCSYKSTRGILKMLPTKGERVLVGPGEDAGVVSIGEDWVISFKIESHNHPSAVDPYNGSTTGIGGIIRDILCMGMRPIGLLDSLHFGKLKNPHNQWLLKWVVKGISDYGNCIGVPNVGGEIQFDDSFTKNCLVNVGCLGLGKVEDISRSAAGKPGNLLILMGGSTGRDGIQGVTFASKTFTGEEEEERHSVQIGDPFMKKKIIEASIEILKTGKVDGFKDFGGGGLSCVTSEMATISNVGVELDLEKVTIREEDMSDYEIMVSESQERMLLSIAPEHVEEIVKILEKWEVPNKIVGKVIDKKTLRIVRENKIIAEMPPTLLTEVPTISRETKEPKYFKEISELPEPNIAISEKDYLLKLLGEGTITSKKWVFTQYDHEVGLRSSGKPGAVDACVLNIHEAGKMVGVKTDSNSLHCYRDPYLGVQGVILECMSNLATVGMETIALVNCLNFGDPRKPEAQWQFVKTVEGMTDILTELKIPVVGGNVSLYNEDDITGQAIKPTPVIMCLGLLEKIQRPPGIGLKKPGEKIYIIGETKDEMGGSELYVNVLGTMSGVTPKIQTQKYLNQILSVQKSVSNSFISAAHDISKGGLAVALTEMCISGTMGCKISIEDIPVEEELNFVKKLYSESYGRFIVSVKDENEQDFINLMKQLNVEYKLIGTTINEKEIRINDKENQLNCELDETTEIWKNSISKTLGVK